MIVQDELYTWCAVYSDDCTSLQEDEKNNFDCVDQTKIKALLLLPLQEHGVEHRVDIPCGAQSVFFRRRRLVINPMDGQENKLQPIHCIGWKHGDNAVYLFVLWDNTTLLTNDLQAV
jgi:hypothetical protein